MIAHGEEEGVEDSRVAYKNHEMDPNSPTCNDGTTYSIIEEEGDNEK